jgi:hypothetical protein
MINGELTTALITAPFRHAAPHSLGLPNPASQAQFEAHSLVEEVIRLKYPYVATYARVGVKARAIASCSDDPRPPRKREFMNQLSILRAFQWFRDRYVSYTYL